MNKNSGYIVKTKDGKLGRTFHNKGLVLNKVPVYLATGIKEEHGIPVPIGYTHKAILCAQESLKQIGNID